jgi:hypothetical protein
VSAVSLESEWRSASCATASPAWRTTWVPKLWRVSWNRTCRGIGFAQVVRLWHLPGSDGHESGRSVAGLHAVDACAAGYLDQVGQEGLALRSVGHQAAEEIRTKGRARWASWAAARGTHREPPPWERWRNRALFPTILARVLWCCGAVFIFGVHDLPELRDAFMDRGFAKFHQVDDMEFYTLDLALKIPPLPPLARDRAEVRELKASFTKRRK